MLNVDSATYRAEPNATVAFNMLRRRTEAKGVFVLLKGDIGNYVTAIDTAVFRGFSIADRPGSFCRDK